MKRFHVMFSILLAICCFAAGKASLGETKPLSPAVMRGVLRITAGVKDISPPEGEDNQLPPEAPPLPDEKVIFEKTITTAPLSFDGLHISNLANAQVDINELLTLPSETDKGSVLILHTHGCEAYTPTAESNYEPSSDFRTTNVNFNVVRVGNEIQKELESFGIPVVHDTTLCDYPDYNSSYSNSLAIAKKYLAEYPDIKVILDVHRDSIAGENGEQIKTVGGENTAQLMFVVGTDTGGKEHPLWRQNLSFALKLQKKLSEKYPKLMRPINLRSSRFNQQVSTGSLILEVGSDGNTLEEALNAARIFGRELGSYLTGLARPQT